MQTKFGILYGHPINVLHETFLQKSKLCFHTGPLKKFKYGARGYLSFAIYINFNSIAIYSAKNWAAKRK